MHRNGHPTAGETLRIPATGGAPKRILANAPGLIYVDGSLWAAGVIRHGGRVVLAKLDPVTGKVLSSIPFPSDHLLETLAGGAGGVWVINAVNRPGGKTTLDEANTKGTRIVQSIPLAGVEPPGSSPHRVMLGLAVGEGAVWVLNLGFSANSGEVVDGYVLRISPRRGKVTGTVSVGHTNELAVGDGAVWTTKEGMGPVRIDTKTLKVTRVHAKEFEPFAVGEGGVWFMQRGGSKVSIRRLNPKTLRVDVSIKEPSFPSTVGLQPALDQTSHTIWVPSDDYNKLTRIDLP